MSLTRKERRILVCKDVIKNLKVRRLIARMGFYIQYHSGIHCAVSSGEPKNLQSVIKATVTKKNPCSACALGSLFITKVDRFNKCESDPFMALSPSGDKFNKQLLTLFSRVQLNMIESAFECTQMASYEGDDPYSDFKSGQLERAARFGRKFGSANDRLIAIMKNIIKNDGIFKP